MTDGFASVWDETAMSFLVAAFQLEIRTRSQRTISPPAISRVFALRVTPSAQNTSNVWPSGGGWSSNDFQGWSGHSGLMAAGYDLRKATINAKITRLENFPRNALPDSKLSDSSGRCNNVHPKIHIIVQKCSSRLLAAFLLPAVHPILNEPMSVIFYGEKHGI